MCCALLKIVWYWIGMWLGMVVMPCVREQTRNPTSLAQVRGFGVLSDRILA